MRVDLVKLITFSVTPQLREHISVPVMGNGHCFTVLDAEKWREIGLNGVMAGRGLLANPALFAGFEKVRFDAHSVCTLTFRNRLS